MNRIEMSDEKKMALTRDIRGFFESELDQDIGDLKAVLVLDFFMERLGMEIYNQGVDDSYKYLQEKLEDLFEIKLYK